MRSPPPIVALVGPTASGKTDLALAIARRAPVEILVADSRQVYRGMDIATAKPDTAARAAVPHHLIDLVAPDEPFSVADWLAVARPLVHEVARRGRLPLVVGGSGLYVSALIDGYQLGSAPPASLRRALSVELEESGLEALAARLGSEDPAGAARTDLRNPRRVTRALERAAAGGEGAGTVPWPGEVVLIGLSRPIGELRRRIAERAKRFFSDGLLEEVRSLLAAGYSPDLPPMTGHGYQEAARHLAGEWSLEEAIAATVRRTGRYAKRQMTWFRRDPRIIWLELGDRPSADREFVDQAISLLPPPKA